MPPGPPPWATPTAGSMSATGAFRVICASDATIFGNVISANGNWGVWISGAGVSGVVVEGNKIGTDVSGTVALGNVYSGIQIDSGALDNTIGGTVDGAGNVISGNADFGIEFSGTSNNLVINNTIGMTADLSGGLGNGVNGINIENGSTANTIGGTGIEMGNRVVCTDPGFAAIAIGNNGDGSNDNLILGNTIGLNGAGTAALGVGNGIYIGSDHNTVGGTVAGARNYIVGASGFTAIWLNSSGSFDNVIEGNYVGLTTDGTASAGGGTGFAIGSAHDNTIGGTASGAGNVISGNAGDGLYLQDADANLIAGNLIGTDATGSYAVPNGSDGIQLAQGSANNTIGGTASTAGNVIAFNASTGIAVGVGATDQSTGNVILNDSIQSNAGGGVDNDSSGVLTISGSTISGNSTSGSGGGVVNESSGTVTITSSTIASNSAGTDGGGIDNEVGTMTLDNTNVEDNTASANGGGISNAGTLLLSDTTSLTGDSEHRWGLVQHGQPDGDDVGRGAGRHDHQRRLVRCGQRRDRLSGRPIFGCHDHQPARRNL